MGMGKIARWVLDNITWGCWGEGVGTVWVRCRCTEGKWERWVYSGFWAGKWVRILLGLGKSLGVGQ
nr:hypothetical protein [Tanacetum cinerariifolium]